MLLRVNGIPYLRLLHIYEHETMHIVSNWSYSVDIPCL